MLYTSMYVEVHKVIFPSIEIISFSTGCVALYFQLYSIHVHVQFLLLAIVYSNYIIMLKLLLTILCGVHNASTHI